MNLFFLTLFLAISAIFSAIEIAIFALPKAKMQALVDQKRKGAVALQNLTSNTNRLLITILVFSNLVNIAAAALMTSVFIEKFGNSGIGIATGVTTLLVLIFGDIIPKSFAIQNAERIALLSAKTLLVLEILLLPVVFFLELIAKIVNKLTGVAKSRTSEEEVRALITLGKEEGLFDQEASERLHSVLDFEKATVKKIMTPKAQVITFEASQTVEQFLDSVLDAPFDRYPLFEDNPENIIGVLDVIDVVRAVKLEKTDTKLKEIMKKTFFVKENTRLDEILTQFRDKQTSLGIVTDEKNEMVGVFTSQDIVEEIVGDIFERENYKTQQTLNG